MQSLKEGSLLQGEKYKIDATLGQGGFGITYLATQDILDRQVAIKEFFFRDYCEREGDTSHVTLGTQSNKETVERFLKKFIKEARTISGLHHPAIISIYDIFRENGTAYYVMEYIEGESLGDMVKRRGALPEAEALSYIRAVGDALTYIHQRNINHLDVKPSNIMLRKSDNQIVLIDFGVAKQYDEHTKEGTTTTPVGISHGYSPAEQYKKNGVQTFSPQSDVYALAATLFKLLTGQTPPEATEIPDVGLPVEELRQKGVSASVISAIEKAMKPRSSRTQSVAEFIANLAETPMVENDDDDDTEVISVIQAEPEPKPAPEPIPEPQPKPSPKPDSKHRFFYVAAAVIIGLVMSLVLWKKPWADNNNINNNEEEERVIPVVTTDESMSIYMGGMDKDHLAKCSYTGEVDSDGKPHGRGNAYFTDGRYYKGPFVHGVAEGDNAYFEFENGGDTFVGSFVKACFSEGRYTCKDDGSYFIGTFKNGKHDKGNWYDKNGKKLD